MLKPRHSQVNPNGPSPKARKIYAKCENGPHHFHNNDLFYVVNALFLFKVTIFLARKNFAYYRIFMVSASRATFSNK